MWEMILAASIVVLVFLFLFLAVSSFLNGKHLKKQKGYFAELQQSLKKGQKNQIIRRHYWGDSSTWERDSGSKGEIGNGDRSRT